MKAYIASALILATSASLALAQAETKTPPNSPAEKVMKDAEKLPGTGTTMPTAKPDSSSIGDKAAKDHPGTKAGSNADMPPANPETNNLSDKAMKDKYGTN